MNPAALQEAGAAHVARTWCQPGPRPGVPAGEVHVWRVDLDEGQGGGAADEVVLAPSEVGRAARYHYPRDRRRYVTGRAALRRILGRYLGCEPDEVGLVNDRWGKPMLDGSEPQDDLCFNLTHSAGLALFAIARGARIGIDVELVRPDLGVDAIIERHFAPRERRALLAMPPEERRAAFFGCWTRKEAYVKATGTGLSRSWNRFEVATPPRPPALLHDADDEIAASRWSMVEVPAAHGFASALVVEAQPLPIIRHLRGTDEFDPTDQHRRRRWSDSDINSAIPRRDK